MFIRRNRTCGSNEPQVFHTSVGSLFVSKKLKETVLLRLSCWLKASPFLSIVLTHTQALPQRTTWRPVYLTFLTSKSDRPPPSEGEITTSCSSDSCRTRRIKPSHSNSEFLFLLQVNPSVNVRSFSSVRPRHTSSDSLYFCAAVRVSSCQQPERGFNLGSNQQRLSDFRLSAVIVKVLVLLILFFRLEMRSLHSFSCNFCRNLWRFINLFSFLNQTKSHVSVQTTLLCTPTVKGFCSLWTKWAFMYFFLNNFKRMLFQNQSYFAAITDLKWSNLSWTSGLDQDVVFD